MTKAEYLELAAQRYDEFQKLNKIDNFYDYEVAFVKILDDLGREILEKNLGELVRDKRKKNLTTLGYITINNSHDFSKGKNGFQISPRMQELMIYAGQLDSYEKSNEVIKEFTGIDVNATQVYRVTDVYGAEVGKTVNAEPTLTSLKKEEVLYAEADGSMLLTREEGRREVKVGRLFKSSDCIHAGQKPGWISNSQYVACLGKSKEFTAIMDDLIEGYGNLDSRLIFISDGAQWIKNWIDDAFPKAISILDYYHACEHLHAFSSALFTDKKPEQAWVKKQKELLLKSQVLLVIENIKEVGGNSAEAEKLIAYYESNKERMEYKRYQAMGCGIIGSGAIESAHRTVVQKRMKQSGQRWSIQGAQNMLNLRVLRKNLKWSKIIELTKSEFKAAA